MESVRVIEGSERLLSLDILRGITIAGMILVNNGWENNFSFLEHSNWNGLTLSDMVFPFFLFMMGITTYISLSKYGFKSSGGVVKKIIRRSLILFLMGFAINYLYASFSTGTLSFQEVRIMGVLQRIAICYLLVSILSLLFSYRILTGIIVLLLLGYGFLLLSYNGYAPDHSNIAMKIDQQVMGYSHLYHLKPIDPEGILGTIPSVANTLIGFLFGRAIVNMENRLVLTRLFGMLGVLMLIAGLMLSFLLPINKCVWSPTFVLVTCGLASVLEASLVIAVDMKKNGNLVFTFFRIFGVNSLFLYVMSGVLTVFLEALGISMMLYDIFYQLTRYPKLAALLYSLTFVILNFVIAYMMYVRKVFIKI